MRAICDRYGILLCADEVITGFGRLGDWFGSSSKYDIEPDLITCAKGLSSAYARDRRRASRRPVYRAVRRARPRCTRTGSRSAAIRSQLRGRAEEPRDHEARADRRERARAQERRSARTLEQLLDLPIVGDLRGTGYFWALELVKDKETRETFDDDECETLLRGFLSPQLFERGLICRADDRGDPVIQISPPLVAGQKEFDEIDGDSRRGAHRSMATTIS